MASMRRSTRAIKEGFAEEMERFRVSDLTGLPASAAFHLGFLASTVYELLGRVAWLEDNHGRMPVYGGGQRVSHSQDDAFLGKAQEGLPE